MRGSRLSALILGFSSLSCLSHKGQAHSRLTGDFIQCKVGAGRLAAPSLVGKVGDDPGLLNIKSRSFTYCNELAFLGRGVGTGDNTLTDSAVTGLWAYSRDISVLKMGT